MVLDDRPREPEQVPGVDRLLAWVVPQLALYALLLLIVVPRWSQRMAQVPPKADPGAGGLAPGPA